MGADNFFYINHPEYYTKPWFFLDKTGYEFFLDAIVNSIHFYLTCIQIK